VARDPTAGRLAARLLLLHAYDPTAAALIARACELHIEVVKRLAVTETEAVAARSATEKVTGTTDEAQVMLDLAGHLADLAGADRRKLKAHVEALRRLVGRYERDLALAPPIRGRVHTLASGLQVTAIEWVGPDEVRGIEPR
jgi:hypothetical protein